MFGGIGTPLGFGYHFRIRPRSRPRIGVRFGCRSTAPRLATLAFAPFHESVICSFRAFRERNEDVGEACANIASLCRQELLDYHKLGKPRCFES